MESFQWSTQYETGLLEVDEQHRRLVDLINHYGEKLAENVPVLEDIASVCTELFDYAKYHFQEEEELMERVGIDERHLDQHVEFHRSFLADATGIHNDIAPDNPGPASQLLHFLTHWLVHHILHVDQNMARQIGGIESGSTPRDAYQAEERTIDRATEPLLHALNGMFEVVSARNADLDRANKSLEAKVAERTKELSEANLRLEELSLTDSLTGLPNRRHAMRRLEDLWQESVQAATPLVCIMIDADHFKEVNDSYGHDAGDLVLCELARTLLHSLRNDDFVCRLGGDEFFLICPNTDENGGMHIAELIRQEVSTLRIPTGDELWHGSISAGVAIRSAGMESHERLIKLADDGVYAAKRDGKDCVRMAR